MSGITVDRRDHVLITFLSPAAFCASTFFNKCSSTNGPFFKLRDMITSGPFQSDDDEQSTSKMASSFDVFDLAVDPKEKLGDDHQNFFLLHHQVDDQQDSWQHREFADAHPSSDFDQLYQS